ncbi:RING finger protein 37 isoform X3 [Hippoglossus hippoglossus]|uniref:RING finger protein 37 isoform X3 n=1 Tax=Hippoglossus hippoglossus TaxID=8267 RepID=UPI00148D1559|nr:RING finger protein 37 isoform X3 [Hippoglossus hippoglossus]
MVLNLCQPHFYTTVHCNKLCADGYDVSNLVSADPALQRQGFKLEYFLRPPVQVTLTFGFQVELCRVDVELWPWGMDRGQASKRLEISTSSDPLPSHKFNQGHKRVQQKEKIQMQSNFRPQPLFPSPPPSLPANCRQEDLWSRGALSLGAVTQLRVTLAFGGSASALGFKALSVWGQPARCCPPQEVERIKTVHEASERRLPQPGFFTSSVRQASQPQQAATPLSSHSIPEEFLDPLTQEVMMLPMLLPSGVSVDNTTLEECQKREATWGRPPNDPFTGVPFTSTSQPLPNPQLKLRIDHFILQRGGVRRDGMLGRQGEGKNPQASRLIASREDGQSHIAPFLSKSSINSTVRSSKSTIQEEDAGLGQSSDYGNCTTYSQPLATENKSELDQKKKRNLNYRRDSVEEFDEKQLQPQTKRPRHDVLSVPTCSSHEQRLSASLDEALFSALQGRPSFTSNLSQQRRDTRDSEALNTTQQSLNSDIPNIGTGEKTCSACSCSVSVYSTSASSIYRLTCGHLLCRACLQRRPHTPNSVTTVTSNNVLCPTCQSGTPRSDIIRVHH